MTAPRLCLFVVQEVNKIYSNVYGVEAVNDILATSASRLNGCWLELEKKHQAHVINLLSHLAVKTIEKVSALNSCESQ